MVLRMPSKDGPASVTVLQLQQNYWQAALDGLPLQRTVLLLAIPVVFQQGTVVLSLLAHSRVRNDRRGSRIRSLGVLIEKSVIRPPESYTSRLPSSVRNKRDWADEPHQRVP